MSCFAAHFLLFQLCELGLVQSVGVTESKSLSYSRLIVIHPHTREYEEYTRLPFFMINKD